jgi:hypothetical protein
MLNSLQILYYCAGNQEGLPPPYTVVERCLIRIEADILTPFAHAIETNRGSSNILNLAA